MPKAKPFSKSKSNGKEKLERSSKHAKSSSAGPAKLDNGTGALFFYGHKSPPHDFLSQHFLCTFTAPSPVEGAPDMTFQSTEQYMMYHKAVLFEDLAIADQIMETANPMTQKALGRKVAGFTVEGWAANREKIVEEGNWNKFTNASDPRLKIRLLETGDRELVEASPRDRIWGIGFGRERAESQRARWGLNLLGKALMRVRDRLKTEELTEDVPQES